MTQSCISLGDPYVQVVAVMCVVLFAVMFSLVVGILSILLHERREC